MFCQTLGIKPFQHLLPVRADGVSWGLRLVTGFVGETEAKHRFSQLLHKLRIHLIFFYFNEMEAYFNLRIGMCYF